MNPELAWQAALAQLRGMLDANTFASWVEGASFAAYDPAAAVFAVRAPSPLARPWLESRLADTLGRILAGILSAPVTVRFLDPDAPSVGAPLGGASPSSTPSPRAAWDAALAALYAKIDRASYDTWVRAVRLVSFNAGVYTAAVGNRFALEWLEQHVQADLTEALGASLGSAVEVRFVVAAPGEKVDIPAQAGPPASPANRPTAEYPGKAATVQAESLPPEAEMILQAARLSLYDMVVKPDQEIFIPGYLMRWIPYLELSLFMILVGFRQAYYLKAGSQPNGGDEFRVRGDEIARWMGLNESTFWRYLADPRLKYFITQANDQIWTLDPQLGRVRRAINRYRFTASTPLTPGDARRLEDWLVQAGAHKDPIAAVKLALSVPRWDILQDPPPAPLEKDLALFAGPLTVQDVARHACRAGTLDGDSFVKLEDLANKLAAQLMPRQDKVFISWYFLRHWVARLGASPALFVTLLRDRCYHSPEQKRSSVWINGGNEEIAARLGLPRPKTVDEWLPPVFERPQKPPAKAGDDEKSQRLWEQRRRLRDGKRGVVGRFVQRSGYRPAQRSGNRSAQNGSYAWQFEVTLVEPLVEAHQEVYDLLLEMTRGYLVSGNEAEFNALIEELEDSVKARMQVSNETNNGESDGKTTSPHPSPEGKGETSKGANESFEDVENTENGASTTARIGASEVKQGRDGESAAEDGANAGFARTPKGANESQTKARLTELKPLIKTIIGFKPLKDYLNHLIHLTRQQSAHQLVALPAYLVGEGGGWNLSGLLKHNKVSRVKQAALLEAGIQARDFIAQLLYAASPDGELIRSPVNHAIAALLEENEPDWKPLQGAVRPAIGRLAGLAPMDLAEIVKARLRGEMPANLDWQTALGDARPDRVRRLAEELGLGEAGG